MIGTSKQMSGLLGAALATLASHGGADYLAVQKEAPAMRAGGARRMMQSKYIGHKPNRSYYKGIKAMRSPKPRRESDQLNMRDWKPRYP